jgi:hypothetical protein
MGEATPTNLGCRIEFAAILNLRKPDSAVGAIREPGGEDIVGVEVDENDCPATTAVAGRRAVFLAELKALLENPAGIKSGEVSR